jgi:hypothetical protein
MAVVIFSVDVPELVTDVGEKLAVAPFGKLLALRFTLPANAPRAPIFTVKLLDEPRFTVADVGETEIEKVGAFTTKLTAVVCVNPPLVPVTVIVYVPGAVLPLVWTVMLDDVVAGLTLKVAVAPAGSPPADSCTFPANPFTGVMAIE